MTKEAQKAAIRALLLGIETIIDQPEGDETDGIPGIDAVLAKSEQLTLNRSVDQNGFELSFINGKFYHGDLEINTQNGGKITMTSPNGNSWIMSISDTGEWVVQSD